MAAAPTPAAVADALQRAAARYGTPAYVYDLDRVGVQIGRLRCALPPGVQVRYSVKANPAPAVCQAIAGAGVGAEVSSAGELAVALDAGFRPARILVSGPYKEPGLLRQLAALPEALISVDSVSELAALARSPGGARQVLLRLRPDYPIPGDMPAGPSSRFGIPLAELAAAAGHVGRTVTCAGFHVHGGSQILDPVQAARQLSDACALAARAAALLGVVPAVLNLGGGFGVPYAAGDTEFDVAKAAAALRSPPAELPSATVTLALGRYLVADAGWYLTRVVHTQTFGGNPAVVVDGGIHHRPDLCGLDLARRGRPPLLLGPQRSGTTPTAVLGCLCLPWDILAHAAALPALHPGDVLAFPAAGAYGLTAAPAGFLGHPVPAEIALAGGALTLLPPLQLLHSQAPVPAGLP